MKRLFALFIFLFFSMSLFAQDYRTKVQPFKFFYGKYPWQGRWGIKSGVSYRSLEVGIMKTDLPKKKDPDFDEISGNMDGWFLENQNIFASVEYNFKNYLGVKAGYEVNVVFLGARANYIHYFDLKNGNQRPVFLPEIGITGCGYFNVFYGYGIPLNDKPFEFPRHRVTLMINWIFDKEK